MDAELYSRIFCALGIALAGSLVFMAIGYVWMLAGAMIQRPNPLAAQILFEPGHRVRQNLQNLDRHYYLLLSAMLVYGLLLLVAFRVATRNRCPTTNRRGCGWRSRASSSWPAWFFPSKP